MAEKSVIPMALFKKIVKAFLGKVALSEDVSKAILGHVESECKAIGKGLSNVADFAKKQSLTQGLAKWIYMNGKSITAKAVSLGKKSRYEKYGVPLSPIKKAMGIGKMRVSKAVVVKVAQSQVAMIENICMQLNGIVNPKKAKAKAGSIGSVRVSLADWNNANVTLPKLSVFM